MKCKVLWIERNANAFFFLTDCLNRKHQIVYKGCKIQGYKVKIDKSPIFFILAVNDKKWNLKMYDLQKNNMTYSSIKK